MPRQARLDAPGVLHHVMVRGIERRAIFLDDTDRQDFVDRLAGLSQDTVVPIFAWSLLPNHTHLLLRSGGPGLSALKRRLLTGYAVRFNRRHRRCGHLFQNRFKSILVEDEPYFLELVRYLHLNPVRAHLVTSVAELDTYRWSGHARLVGRVNDGWQAVEEVLGRFGRRAGRARQAYRAFVAEGFTQGTRPELMGGGLKRSRWGWEPTPKLVRGRERWAFDERILGSGDFTHDVLADLAHSDRSTQGGTRKMDPSQLLRKLTDRLECSAEGLRARPWQSATVSRRSVVSHVGVVHLGHSLRAMARCLGVSAPTVLRDVRRGADEIKRLGMTVEQLLA